MAMAASKHNYLEETRPPEDPVKRKHVENARHNYKHYSKQSGIPAARRLSIGAVSLPAGLLYTAETCANNNSAVRTLLDCDVDESNRNNCANDASRSHTNDANCNNVVMKSDGLSQTRRPASLPAAQGRDSTNVYRKRSSYHQDVEEALSSLLWQPYEYRTHSSDSSETLSSLSTGSSSSTSLSLDLTTNKNKGGGGGCGVGGAAGMLQSFTDEFLNVTTACTLLPAVRTPTGNGADPNLAAQMVSNLMVLDAATVGPPFTQCGRSVRSRGADTGSTLSQLDVERSRVRESFGRAYTTSRHFLARNSAAPSCSSVSAYGEDALRSCVSAGGEMRVEIPGPVAERPPDVLQRALDPRSTSARPQSNVVFPCSSVSVSEDCMSVQSPGRVLVQPVNPRCSTISSDMIPSNITSVVSANVVGLPVHARSNSNLSGAPCLPAPNHPRSVSETASVFGQPPSLQLNNHFRSSSNLASTSDRLMIPNHPRNISLSGAVQTRGSSEPANIPTNSHASTSNNHRSSSVPHSTTDISIITPVTQIRTNSDNTKPVTTTHLEQAPVRVPPLPNVSNVNVNFYRAVPVTVVSSVPTIQCLNSVEEAGNNISNVHIVQAMPSGLTNTTVNTQHVLVQQDTNQPTPATEVRTRTFTSTEAQTDDTAVGNLVTTAVLPPVNREQRRRERRERRHQRRLNSSNHPHQQQQQQPQQHPQTQQWHGGQQNDRLPDLLNSHLPPPYSTLPSSLPSPAVVPGPIVPTTMVSTNILPSNMVPSPIVPNSMVPFHPGVVPGQVPLVQGAPPVPVSAPPTGFRFPFPTAAGFRRCRSRLGPRYSTEEHQPKSCCGFLVSRPGSLRWFIALIALVAVCCVLVGTVLGAMRPAGRDHLTVSLLMIGVGIVLVTVSGVAWRLTSHDAPSCRAMLGLESSDSTDICTRRFVPRLPPSYGRPHHPYAAMIYPEFQYRPPPPSYQASMQEYRLRLLLLDRGATPQIQNAQHSVSPPPTYRSHAGSLLRAPLSSRRDATQSEYSCPPSYRSRTSSNRPAGNDTIVHSREQSLSLSESNHDGSVVNVVNILANQEEEIALENMTLDSLKVAPENEIPPLRMLLKSASGSDLETLKDGNLVTIVQKADQNPVIVTVSGSQMSTTNPEVGSSNQIPSEMEILAHL